LTDLRDFFDEELPGGERRDCRLKSRYTVAAATVTDDDVKLTVCYLGGDWRRKRGEAAAAGIWHLWRKARLGAHGGQAKRLQPCSLTPTGYHLSTSAAGGTEAGLAAAAEPANHRRTGLTSAAWPRRKPPAGEAGVAAGVYDGGYG